MSEYVLALLKCKGIGNVKVLNFILKYQKDINKIKNNLSELISFDDLENFEYYLDASKSEIESNKNNGINVISILDEGFPDKLIDIKDPILYLYYKGDINLINNISIAVIGSRNVNEMDEKLAQYISNEISRKGVTVVSGLAVGIDTSAHFGSYKNVGKTIAVLPSGLNVITPSSNNVLANSILENGGLLVSEYSFNTKATQYTFVKRDRIQAALSDVVLVIKADENSGTMHAVNVAQNSNRFVAQYKSNVNKYIHNSFDESDECIMNLIKQAKDKSLLVDSKKYTQESLF